MEQNNELLCRIAELEKKLKEKEESEKNLEKEISTLQSQINLSNTTISNLTEEKENYEIKVEELQKENEQLKKEYSQMSVNQSLNDNKKKTDDETKILKKKINNLIRDKDELEEVIMKQEEKVTQLSKQISSTSRLLSEKDKELQDNVLYTAKLTSIINSQKKELNNLKQTPKFEEDITSLKEEIMKLRKDNEAKQNKINLLQMNNRILKHNSVNNNNNNASNADGIPKTATNVIRPSQSGEVYEPPPRSAGGRNKIILSKIKPKGGEQFNREINPTYKSSFKNSKFSIEGKDSGDQKAYIVAKSKSRPKVSYKPLKKINNEINEQEEQLRKNQDLENIVFKPIVEKTPKVDISADLEYPVYETKCELGASGPKVALPKCEDKKEIEKLSNEIDNLLDQI